LGCAFELIDDNEIDKLRFSINKAEVASKQVRRSEKVNEHSKLVVFLISPGKNIFEQQQLTFQPSTT